MSFTHQELAGIPPGCAHFYRPVRWCHSFLARPPANGCHAFGMFDRMHGMEASSNSFHITMPINITLPRLGWSMEEGTFMEWLKRDGDVIKEG